MVSLKTVLTLGAIGVGVVLFFGAGGFSGVGQKIGSFVGGGLREFSGSITSSLTGGLFGGSTNPATGGSNNEIIDTSTGIIGPAPRTGTEEFDPIGNLIGNFKGLQNILDTLNNAARNIFTSTTPSPVSQRTFDFAVTQLRAGQTVADITDRGIQGSAVARTGESFISNLGGRERAFGSQESLNSFIERFNR